MTISIVTNDKIKIDRLAKYFPDYFEWNLGERVTINDISSAIANGQKEEEEMYNPNTSMPNEWHIGRVIYFINHPEEIKYIEIKNADDGYSVLPTPILIEGYHRFIAAYWLYLQGKLEEVYCIYDGRRDILEYLKGIGRKPSKWIQKEKAEPKDICVYCIEDSCNKYYYELYNGRLVLGNDIKKAKKFSETVAKDMMEMFKQMYPDSEYKIVKEEINY